MLALGTAVCATAAGTAWEDVTAVAGTAWEDATAAADLCEKKKNERQITGL